MAKNIVVCADGTGNKFCDTNTNVVRMYSVLDLGDPARQIAYYHGGLGTMGASGALSHVAQRWTKAKGLAFGYGLTHDIAECYSFLMDTYEEGDRLYLFGFSRGAYTVRALSGLLHMFGLIRPQNYNLTGYATEMLKSKQDAASFQVAADFKRTFSRECPTHFMGVWDTVSSVGWVWDPLHIPYTAKNPDIRTGRHAVAIDERRCFFRQNLWGAALPGQSLKQVWFAGVHSDIGGGYPEAESGLAKISFEWVLCEVCQAGLLVDRKKATEVLGYNGGVTPDAAGMMHNSLKDAWMLLEPLPHRYYDMTCHPPKVKYRLPLGRRRHVPEGVNLHESVRRRPGYKPPNLPTKTGPDEPWVRWVE